MADSHMAIQIGSRGKGQRTLYYATQPTMIQSLHIGIAPCSHPVQSTPPQKGTPGGRTANLQDQGQSWY